MAAPPATSVEMNFSISNFTLMDDEPSDFDYATFFQGGEDYFAETRTTSNALSQTSTSESSQSQSLLAPVSSSSSATPTTLNAAGSGFATTPGQAKQRHERRGHTKSRRGCFNCKRRRIKCQETRPACGHCVKTGLKCEYPTLPQLVNQPQSQPIFSLLDMRFLQHFLLQCCPHSPMGSEKIWLHEIPALSEKYEYLMHAILGFAASDLMQSDPGLLPAAIDHRFKAIRAIKKTLSDVPRADTFEEGNAMMATCFVLTFQSVFLSDGMAEYMTFIRGIIVVAIQMYLKGAKMIFGDFLGDKQNEALAPYVESVPLIRKAWTDGAFAAVQRLGPLCQTQVEMRYHEMLMDICRHLYVSSWGAYKAMTKHYGWWMMLPQDQFQQLIDPGNQVCVLLASHWIALKQIMALISETERKASVDMPGPRRDHGIELGIVRWLKHLNGLVDVDHQVYNQWPLWVEGHLDRDRGYSGNAW